MKTIFLFSVIVLLSCQGTQVPLAGNQKESFPGSDSFANISDTAWRSILTPEEYKVLREKATEIPYTGEYDQFWDSGTYVCKACGLELFHSEHKFDAGCGWPSFFETADSTRIREVPDSSHGMVRIEIQCARCHGHLGHVFPDGPGEKGLRYCVNSLSLGFESRRKP